MSHSSKGAVNAENRYNFPCSVHVADFYGVYLLTLALFEEYEWKFTRSAYSPGTDEFDLFLIPVLYAKQGDIVPRFCTFLRV